MNRIDDYVKFHDKSCTGDSIVAPLIRYSEYKNYSVEDLEKLCLIYTLTYCISSTIIVMNKLSKFHENPNKFWVENKNQLIFQSDRKYVKINDKFVDSYFDFINKGIFEYLRDKTEIDVFDVVTKIEKVDYFGRFSAFLFLEIYCSIFKKKFQNQYFDWKNGATVTSGILNVLGEDEKANEWDKTHNSKLLDIPRFNETVDLILSKVKCEKNIAILEGNLCQYRKLFKGSRYLGFYADRMLEEIYSVFDNYPELKMEKNLLLQARKETLDNDCLGELNGWYGIRPELKKHYIKTGKWNWYDDNSKLF